VVGNLSGVIIAPAFRTAVTYVMLGTSQNMVLALVAIFIQFSLEALYGSHSHFCSQVWIFTKSLHDSPPAWIVSNIQHRSKTPVNPQSGAFFGGNVVRFLDGIGVKCGSQSQGNGKNYPQPVDDIQPVNHRNTQAEFIHGNPLDFIQIFNPCSPLAHITCQADRPQDAGTQTDSPDAINDFAGVVGGNINLDALGNFFLQCHAR